MIPKFIAYFTPGPYAGEAEKLVSSLTALKLQAEVVKVPDLGSWQKNTQYKATFIRERVESGPLVYIDVDAVVLKRPTLFGDLNCDIAAARFKGTELLSGTVYLGGTPKAVEVVDRWIALCNKYPQTLPDGRAAWDQKILDMAIKDVGCRFTELPPAYTFIVGLSQREYPEVDPVILHTRGRMRFEDVVNRQ